MKNSQDSLEEVLARVQAGKGYNRIAPSLVSRIARHELSKGRSIKESVKATRSKLHQIAGAYLTKNPDYGPLQQELASLPRDRQDERLRDFCLRIMQSHASTRERLPVLHDFFMRSLAPLAPLRSILDIGCGMNPLAIPWMPLDTPITYHGIDIYSDMTSFLDRFIAHLGCQGNIVSGDMLHPPLTCHVQLAMLLKVLPVLEQQEKHTTAAFLDSIPADNLLVSFPVHSLGGKKKGMLQFYEEQFLDVLSDSSRRWHIRRFEFNTELAFLLQQ